MSVTGDDGPALACPRCASPVDERQEYCLECGLRLPREIPRALVPRPPGAAAGDATGPREWLLPALLGLVVAVLGTAAAVGISEAGGAEDAISTATGGNLTFTDTGETLTAPEPGSATAAPPATQPPPGTTAPRTSPATTTWPARKRGWTIVLLSLPQRAGRPVAEERAAEARRRGLRNVGVLNSSRFASLHPGYFVIFNGVFDSQAEAAGALQRSRAAFPGAYQREIVP